MNTKQIKVVGGAVTSPIVKAVLDNVGRRYLVEHTEAEDGSWQYDLYSDGWLVQSGVLRPYTPGSTPIPLPKEFESKDYKTFLQISRPNFTEQWQPDAGTGFVTNVKPEAFSIAGYNPGSMTEYEMYWEAQGYAA